MKTVQLNDENAPTMDEILSMARQESILIVSLDGTRYVLEEADEFEREIAELGNSRKFMDFLQARSTEKSTTSVDDFAKALEHEDR